MRIVSILTLTLAAAAATAAAATAKGKPKGKGKERGKWKEQEEKPPEQPPVTQPEFCKTELDAMNRCLDTPYDYQMFYLLGNASQAVECYAAFQRSVMAAGLVPLPELPPGRDPSSSSSSSSPSSEEAAAAAATTTTTLRRRSREGDKRDREYEEAKKSTASTAKSVRALVHDFQACDRAFVDAVESLAQARRFLGYKKVHTFGKNTGGDEDHRRREAEWRALWKKATAAARGAGKTLLLFDTVAAEAVGAAFKATTTGRRVETAGSRVEMLADSREKCRLKVQVVKVHVEGRSAAGVVRRPCSFVEGMADILATEAELQAATEELRRIRAVPGPALLAQGQLRETHAAVVVAAARRWTGNVDFLRRMMEVTQNKDEVEVEGWEVGIDEREARAALGVVFAAQKRVMMDAPAEEGVWRLWVPFRDDAAAAVYENMYKEGEWEATQEV